ncbi:MAG TPA: DUF342 domain-containing protein, partial [Desulfobacterales bacterium]|nr:DUF342 domain-containing protein [Desulfobacterales bacterium]
KNYFIIHHLIHPKTLGLLIDTLDAVKTIKMNKKFGTLAVKMGFIDNKTLQAALMLQKKAAVNKKQPLLIDQVLIDAGKLTKEQRALVVKEWQNTNQKTVFSKLGTVPKETDKKSKISEKIQDGMVLDIEDGGMSAYFQKTKIFNTLLTVDDIYNVLLTKHIQYGIKSKEEIEGFINSSGFEKNRFKIASGTHKILGSDAIVSYYFDTRHLTAGKVNETGIIDFKDRGEIPKIKTKTLLVEKIPLKESKNGRDVFGNEIQAAPARDISLKCGAGAVISEDGLRVYAEISGYPKLSLSGEISVVDFFMVKGDVSYETGHIRYDGNIDINGGLKNGFKINGIDIKINEIDGGEIHAQGDVTIINGVNNAKIYSRGHIYAKFVHNSKLRCLGNVVVEKEIVDSQIESSGACQIMTGDIVSSTINFNQGIHAKNIGTERSDSNWIVVGQDLFRLNELQRIEEKTVSLEKKRLSLEKKKDRFSSEKQPEKNETKIQSIDSACDDIENQIDHLNQEKADFVGHGKSNTEKSVVIAAGKIWAGTVIHTRHAQKTIKETVSNVQVEEVALQKKDGDRDLFEIQINDNGNRL